MQVIEFRAASSSKKKDLLGDFLRFTRFSSIKHLHSSELMIGDRNEAYLSQGRNHLADGPSVRLGSLFAGDEPRIDRELQHHEAILQERPAEAHIITLILGGFNRKIEHGKQPHTTVS